jgi:Icc-related predicted phosphoesterase
MIIDCISDLHGHYPKLDGGDLLIVAGDLTASDSVLQNLLFYKWVGSQKYKRKLFIGGNHDNYMQTHRPVILEIAPNTHYLCDSGVEFEGIKIWGSPWTSQFPGINPKCCAFTRPFCIPLKDRWDLIPDDVDILVTHGPPFGVLDKVERDYGASVGDIDLRDALEKRIRPRLHVFGHIHENGGQQLVFKRPGFGTENNTICVNASHVNECYKPVNPPVRIIL